MNSRVDRRLQALHEFSGLSLLFGVIDAPVTHDFAIGEDVFRDGEIAKQIQFLEHHADAMSDCVARAPEVDRRPIEQDPPRSRPFDARDHLYQGRFTGPVFADQNIDSAPAHLEIGVLHGNGARINLRHAFEAQDDVPATRRIPLHDFGPIVISTGVTKGLSAVETNG